MVPIFLELCNAWGSLFELKFDVVLFEQLLLITCMEWSYFNTDNRERLI